MLLFWIYCIFQTIRHTQVLEEENRKKNFWSKKCKIFNNIKNIIFHQCKSKLHLDYKTHPHFPPKFGGKVHLIVQKIRETSIYEPTCNILLQWCGLYFFRHKYNFYLILTINYSIWSKLLPHMLEIQSINCVNTILDELMTIHHDTKGRSGLGAPEPDLWGQHCRRVQACLSSVWKGPALGAVSTPRPRQLGGGGRVPAVAQ